MVRKVLIALAGGVALALSSMSPALAAETADPQVERHTIRSTVSEKSLKTFGQLQLRNLKTGTIIRPFADPPGGGCRYPVGFEGIASYTNGTLTSVTLDYYAQVVCEATAPGQSMGGIVVTAQMWKNGTNIGEAPTVNCVDCLVSPVSQNFYACGGVTCAGGYWAGNLHALRAPLGYVWNSAPAGCIGLGTAPYEWIQCSSVTEVVTVSPTN